MMLCSQKSFTETWSEISNKCLERYGIDVGRNAQFVCETIFDLRKKKGTFTYAECGVFRGTTFLPVYHLCEALFENFALYALDSFSGFPEETVLNDHDVFEKFQTLFQDGKITREHLDAAKERCQRIPEKEHLKKDYFGSYEEEFLKHCDGKKEIEIVKSSFSELKSTFTNDPGHYDLVFLDCDLYLSYRECLEYFAENTGVFVFDEYYSHKYPGARIACDEFVQANPGWSFFNKVEANPYFERWGIRKQR